MSDRNKPGPEPKPESLGLQDPLQALRNLAAFQRLQGRFAQNPNTQEGLAKDSLTYGDIADVEELFWMGMRDLSVTSEPQLNPHLRFAARRAMEIMLPTVTSSKQRDAMEKFLAETTFENFDREQSALQYSADMRVLFAYELGGPEFEIVHSGSAITVVRTIGSEGRYHIFMPNLDGSDGRYPHRVAAFTETGLPFRAEFPKRK